MTTEQTKNGTPAVSAVMGSAIVELVYDHSKNATAFAVAADGRWERAAEFETPAGERLLPYGPGNNLIAHRCVRLPAQAEPSGGKAALLSNVEQFLHRYVDLSPLFEKVAAHYVLLSWVYDAFNEIPILRLKGPFGSGKTRALIALGSIAYRGFFASGASTVSPIFHTLDRFGGTLVLDEADLRYSDKTADLVKILNNGTVRGLPVLRTLQNRHKEFNPAAFQVFGPKIIAMRGSFRDPALESRCITEPMGKRPMRSDIPIQLPNTLEEEALHLRNRLLGFRFETLFDVGATPSRQVEGVDPRLNQMALPLLSLMDDPALREEFTAMLWERQEALMFERETGFEARVASALKAIFAESGSNVPLHRIAVRANENILAEPMTARDVGRVLRELGIPLRKSHGAIVVPKSASGVLHH